MRPEMEAPPPELEDLFASERARPGPSPQVTERMLAAVQSAIAIPVIAPVPPVVASAATKGISVVLAKTGVVAVVAFVVGGVCGATLYAKILAPPAPPQVGLVEPPAFLPEPIAAPVAAAHVVAPPAQLKPVRPAPAPPARAPLAPPTPSGPITPDADPAATLSAERTLLEQARTSLTRQHPVEAAKALEQHLARFPEGQLSEERESLWIQALLATGDRAGAASHARAFQTRFPRSIFLHAVEALLPDDSVTE